MAVKAHERPIVQDLPEGTYIELVASLCGTRFPAIIMTTLFAIVGAFSVRATHDSLLCSLVVVGVISSAARLVVLIRGRWLCDHAAMSFATAKRFERQFTFTYWAFATLFGLFAARAYALPPAAWQMPVSILVVGYAAGAAATVALRPFIVVTSLILAVVPPAGVLLFYDDATALVSSLCLFALLAGGLRSVTQRYRSQSAKTTMRQAFALQAKSDYLTGLGNRLALADAFAAHTGSDRHGRVAFHYVDLDDFKPVNDQLGHRVGDILLCLVAERLQASRDPGDVIVRLGGDEFVTVQIDAKGDLDVERQTARIEHALNIPYIIDGRSVLVGASVGSSRYTGAGQTMESLLAAADDALRQKKTERKSRSESGQIGFIGIAPWES